MEGSLANKRHYACKTGVWVAVQCSDNSMASLCSVVAARPLLPHRGALPRLQVDA